MASSRCSACKCAAPLHLRVLQRASLLTYAAEFSTHLPSPSKRKISLGFRRPTAALGCTQRYQTRGASWHTHINLMNPLRASTTDRSDRARRRVSRWTSDRVDPRLVARRPWCTLGCHTRLCAHTAVEGLKDDRLAYEHDVDRLADGCATTRAPFVRAKARAQATFPILAVSTGRRVCTRSPRCRHVAMNPPAWHREHVSVVWLGVRDHPFPCPFCKEPKKIVVTRSTFGVFCHTWRDGSVEFENPGGSPVRMRVSVSVATGRS